MNELDRAEYDISPLREFECYLWGLMRVGSREGIKLKTSLDAELSLASFITCQQQTELEISIRNLKARLWMPKRINKFVSK